jgi:hypothetical protein
MGSSRRGAYRNSDDSAPGWYADCVAGVVCGRRSHGCNDDSAGTKKIARVRHDPRASFLVESGERWVELRAVHLTGRVEIVEDATSVSRIESAVNDKYAAFRPPVANLPAATQAYYASQVFLRFVPEGRILTWDNARIAMTEA